jgi:hypothetical protein
VVRGFEDRTFRPDAPVSRGQMATFLVGALKLADGPPARFVDVPRGHDHARAIDAISAAGITRGADASGTHFLPDAPVTRAQMATFIARGWRLRAGA